MTCETQLADSWVDGRTADIILETECEPFQTALNELLPDGFVVESIDVRNPAGELVRWITQ